MSFSELSATLTEAVRLQTERLVAFLPNLGIALLLLLIGWILGRIVRGIVRRICSGAVVWLSRHPLFGHGVAGGSLQSRIPAVVAGVAFWGVMLLFGAAAVERLQIPALSEALSATAYYLPLLLTALIIGLAGVIAGGVVRHWVTATLAPVGVAQAQMVGRLAQFATVTIALILAADQAGIHSTILILALGIVMLTSLGGIALAFAIGCGPIVGNLVASHYVTKQFTPGQVAEVAGRRGTIREITSAFVILEAEGEEILVPASQFLQEVSSMSSARLAGEAGKKL